MKNATLVVPISLFLLLTTASLCTAADTPPNVVLIMADDMGYEALSVNGSESCKSPNLDKLAATGVRFTNCFANPLCTPSRAKIMTGQYNVRNYVKFGMLDRGQTTFAHQLKAAGYATCIAGKWQLGDEPDSPQHFGFEKSCLWQHTRSGRSKADGKTYDRRFVNPLLEFNGKEEDYVDGAYGPQVCTDFICDFIDENKEKPFLVYYPMILTHCPFDPTPDSTDWDPKRLGSTTYKGDRNDPQRHFRDMVAYADKLVGQVVAQLEKSGVRDNTLLIFTGDNGTDKPIVTEWNGRKVVGGKGTMTDEGTRVPMIANWPAGIKQPGRVADDLVEFCDIMPTLCEVTGAELPTEYPGDGSSIAPVLNKNATVRKKDWIYIWYRGQVMVRDKQYSLVAKIDGSDARLTRYRGSFDGEQLEDSSLSAHERAIKQQFEATLSRLAETRLSGVNKNASQEQAPKKKKNKTSKQTATTPENSAPANAKKPNFVIIFTDDQGYGDLSCYGGKHVSTPRIDQMAAEGSRLTSFYVAAPVCTPSRAALMTGCYPKRIDMATGSNFGVLLAGDRKGLNPDEITIAEVLKTAGYKTGMFGKWHLGDQPEFLPTKQGFDEFFGVPYSHDIHPFHPRQDHYKFPPLPLLENETVIEMDPDADFLTKRITQRAVSFIETNKDAPFFLYIPHPIPHAPLHVSPPFMETVSDDIVATLKKEDNNIDYRTRDKIFRQAIAEIDWSVGQILDTLKANGLDENTLVLFTSDNGPPKNSLYASPGPLRGNKGTTLEGGMREPTVVRWPGKIPAGKPNDELMTTMDLLPTFAKLAGAEIPTDRAIDGKDIWPTLAGETNTPHEVFFYHRGNALAAVRSGKWKLHVNKGKPAQLYDLESDIGEKNNVIKAHPEVVKRLNGHLKAFAKDIANNSRPAAFVENPKPLAK